MEYAYCYKEKETGIIYLQLEYENALMDEWQFFLVGDKEWFI